PRQTLHRLDRGSSRPARRPCQRVRCPAGGGHLASRDRLHPHPHLRRHPPPRARHQARGRRGPGPPGLQPPAIDRPLGPDHRRPPPPATTSTLPEGGNPMSKSSGTGRNQRNNPYQLDELFVKFHRTPAGIAWRWRTELLTLSGLAVAFWRLDTWTTALWAGGIL